MNQKNISMIVYVVVSLVAVSILGYLLYDCKKKEKFCGACTPMGMKTNPNRALLHKLYNEGKLTEFSNFGKNPQWGGAPWDQFLQHEAAQKGHGPGCH